MVKVAFVHLLDPLTGHCLSKDSGNIDKLIHNPGLAFEGLDTSLCMIPDRPKVTGDLPGPRREPPPNKASRGGMKDRSERRGLVSTVL